MEGDGGGCNDDPGCNRGLENGVTEAVVERPMGNGEEGVVGGRSAGMTISTGKNRRVSSLL